MQVTDAGTTLVLSDTTEAEKKRILSLLKQPEQAPLETLTRKEVGQIFGIHEASCKRWEKAGKLRPIKITARTVRYNKADILAMIEGGAA